MPTIIDIQPDAGLLWRQKVNPPGAESHIAPAAHWRFVSNEGRDDTGTGSVAEPWATLTAAMANITDASPTKRYAIWITGRIQEAGPVALKPNIFIVGAAAQQARVQATQWTLDGAWSEAGDHRSGFKSITVAGPMLWDFAAVSSNEGKLYFTQTWANGDATFRAFSAVNQVYALASLTFAPWSFEGCNLTTQGTLYQAPVSLTEAPNGTRFDITSAGDSFLSGLTLTKAVADAPDAAVLYSAHVDALTVNGALDVKANPAAIPAALTLGGGATVTGVAAVRTPGTAPRQWTSGTGSPEGVVIGSVGDLYSQTDGDTASPASVLWLKTSGVGVNTGWASIA